MGEANGIWAGVDRLVDLADDLSDLREHRLHLLAARRWRELGRSVPAQLVAEERTAAIVTMTAPIVLERVRAALEGPVLLMKGPEVASRYPDDSLRPYGDVDLLVPDADGAHRALKAAGFVEVGDPAVYVGIHHLRPLMLPKLPVTVEVHTAPKWIDGLEPPPNEELFAGAVPSSVGVAGIETLSPEHHTVVLAVHSWAHEPLRRALELVDIAAMSEGLDRDELRRLARAWDVHRVWNVTIRAADALLGNRGDPPPFPLRLWARNLPRMRARTVLENHVERWVAAFWALPPRKAFLSSLASLARTLGPIEGEPWSDKLARTRLAFRNAFVARWEHEQRLRERRRE